MSDEPELRGILVSHGSMAAGMVDAVRRITGVAEDVLQAVSNDGRSPEELRDAILERVQDGPAVVFTDLVAGSCTLTARLCCRDRPRLVLITGVNLPMLLDFVFHRTDPLEVVAARLVTKGREGVRVLG